MTALTGMLIVDAGNLAVRIEVLDAGYQVRARGYGVIEASLPTGFYTVRYSAADAVQHRDFTLSPGSFMALVEPPNLHFATTAPLKDTWTSHEHHQRHARRLSLAAPLVKGDGGELFVFVRDLAPGGPPGLAKGLSLHRLDGETLLRFHEVVEPSTEKGEARWAGCNIALDPGTYRLRVALGRRKAVEMTTVVCPGWQSQVFLLRGGGEHQVVGQWASDLQEATQLMRYDRGFDPRSSLATHVDLVRQDVLTYGWRGAYSKIPAEFLLGEKSNDPICGIFGLHLLLMGPEPDLDLAEQVVSRLRGSILAGFRHPDVEALAIEIARRRGTSIEPSPIRALPMLRRSWHMLVRATAEKPSLVPPGSLAAQIADRLWGTSAWLIWEVPPEAPTHHRPPLTPDEDWLLQSIEADRGSEAQPRIVELSDRVIIGGVTLFKRGARRSVEPILEETEGATGTQGETPSEAPEEGEIPRSGRDAMENVLRDPDLRSTVRSLVGHLEVARERLTDLGFPTLRTTVESTLPAIERLIERLGADGLAQKAKLDGAEFPLLVQLGGLLRLRQRSLPTPARDPLALPTLVEQLGLPAERVQRAMAGLFLKLLAVLARRR